jgi:type IV pilus assembly protein PilN
MRITLNLATRPYADQGPAIKRLRIGMAALVVVLGLLGLGLMHFHQAALHMAAEQAGVDRSITQIQQEQAGYQVQMQQPANARVLTQAQFLNQLFDEKSFSWTAAMEDLERVLPAGVQVTALEPSRGKDGRLTLRLRTAGPRERSVQLVRNMERSQRFEHPQVSGENAENVNSQGGVQPVGEPDRVNFEILAEYNPATLEERRAEIAAQKRHSSTAASPAVRQNLAQPRAGLKVGPRAGLQPGYVPGYVPPNPQPMRRPVPPQGAAQFQTPMRDNRPPGQGIPPPDQDEPTGYDANGLKNHDRNRIPPPTEIDSVPGEPQ